MFDGAVENARKRKAEILKELEEIDLFLRLHERFSSGVNAERVQNNPEKIKENAKEEIRKTRGRPADFADQMELVLSEVGRPLDRPQMVEELERRGVEIPSEDKQRYLGTILWRYRGRFLRIPEYGYWIGNRPYEPAGYSGGSVNADNPPESGGETKDEKNDGSGLFG